MTASEAPLYRDFAERLLYMDTIDQMRTSIVAADGYDIAAGAAAFDALELDAEQRGWVRTAALSRFIRMQLSELLQPPAVPTEVTGPESLLAMAFAMRNPIHLVNFLRRHRDLVTASLYQHVKVQAMSRRGRPDPAHLLAMYAIARVLDDLTLVVEARLLWSSLLRSSGALTRAERHLNVAVAASATADGRTRFTALAAQAGMHRSALRYAEAIAAFEQMESLADGDPDKIGIAEALADCCREMGLFAKAIDACTRAATLAEQLGWAERVARLLELRGLCHEDRGDYERGRSDYLRVARLAEQRGDRTTQLAAMNNAAGSLLKRGLAREGYVAFREVMRTIERWGNSPAAAAAHNNLGQALLQLERYTEAREHFLRSLQLRMNTGHRAGEIISMIGAGDAAEGMGDAEAARLWYTLAYIPILESGDTASLASIQMRLSDQALLVDDRARQEAIESLRGVRDEVRARSMTTLDAITTHRLAELLDATGDSATALHELHALLARAGDLGSNYVRPARIARARMLSRTRATWADGFTELRGILGEIEAQLAESRIDARKSEIIGETVALYEAMMCALAMPEAPARLSDGQDRVEFAFALHESAKSRTTLLAVADAPVAAPDTIPADLRRLESQLIARERSLQHATEDVSESRRLEELATVDAELKACRAAMRAFAPEYARFRSGEPYSFAEIQSWLDSRVSERAALLSCFCDSDGINVFIIKKHERRPRMLRLPVTRKTLRDAARRLSRTFNGAPDEFPPYPPIRGDAPNRRSLAFLDPISAAFEPVWDAIGDCDLVCVAPHGPLHLLPLHALTTRRRYVAERLAITYVPSLSVLLQLQAQPRSSSGSRRVLTVGVSAADDAHPEFFENDADLFDDAFGEVMSASGLRGASKARVRQQLSDQVIVHFSCHGYFDERNALQSGLVLSNGESKAPRDPSLLPLLDRHEFILTAQELLEVGFAPRLVTLSACSGGLQHVRNHGDELDGFARALLLGGAPAAALGLWNLDQESSREFFRTFYRHLSVGAPKWRAMNAAQRGMLASDRAPWRHPYHWAPYYLLGDWGAL